MKDFIKYFNKFDFFLLLSLPIIGIFLISSATQDSTINYSIKQLFWLILSTIVFFIILRFKLDFIFKTSTAIYFFIIVILIIQILSNRIISGTKSWINLGFFNIQSSEFIKVFIALILAKYLDKIEVINWKEFFKISIIIGLPFLLIGLQPDFGTAFMLISFFIAIFMLKRINKSIIYTIIIVSLLFTYISWNYILKDYQKNRVLSFLNPGKYKKTYNYQSIQSKIAIGSGGLTGKGYKKGSQSKYKFLPIRHTDFILSILGEEFGFIGISFVFMIFFLFIYRQYNTRVQSNRDFNFIFLFTTIILFQFIINSLMTIGLFPIIGIPLPFVSYGGSSLFAFFIGEAIIFKIKLNNFLLNE